MSSDEETAEDRLVRAAAAQLYAGPPAEFVATRTTLVKSAKAEGEKQAAAAIGALRRPSVAAWALNQVVHRDEPVIDELADLGARLRQATSALDAAGLTGLRGARDATLAALVTAASDVAAAEGHRLTAAGETEVRDTGIAALADEAAETALRSGTLTRALSYSGFGEVDLSEATATTSTGVVLTSLRGGRRREATVEEDADAVAQDLGDVEDLEAGDLDADETEDIDEDIDDEDIDDEDEGDEDEGGEAVKSDEGEDVDDHGAAALAEAAAAQEHEHRLARAQAALERATTEVGRHRAAVEAARNRSDATRQRVQKLEAQLESAGAEDALALDKLTEAVSAGKRAESDLALARQTLTELTDS